MGYIHSIETMGLLDGPGIRIVVFFQGCPLRCLFCHNPDTWVPENNLETTPKEIVDVIRKYRSYIEMGGGVTFSGGEPLLQSEFLLETLKLCKKAGIHTCIDTAGNGYDKNLLDEILKYTDLILLDIKALDNDNYKKITTKSIKQFEYFLKRVQELDKKLWIRQVIVPGINDNEEYIYKLRDYIKNIKNVEKIQLLPYSLIGVDKYKKLNIKYRLEGVEAMDKDRCKQLEKILKVGDSVKKDLKIVFMGTPEFSVPVLEGLIENYNVSLVVTQPDKPVGRGGKISISPIKEVALKHNIEVFQPTNIKNDYQKVIDSKPDIIITCAYGQIIPKELLDYPKYRCINVHASLLPKLRGGAPIHHAIIDGYDKTGITIMYMDVRMDTGDIISTSEVIIDNNDTVSSLHDKLKIMGRDLLLQTLPDIISGNIKPIKQDNESATYAYNISKEEEKIDFNKTKKDIYNQIRGLNSFPGAYTILDNKRMKVWSSYITDKEYKTCKNGEITKIYKDGIGIKVSDGEIVITEIQLEGKKRMSASNYLNGINKEKLLGKILS